MTKPKRSPFLRVKPQYYPACWKELQVRDLESDTVLNDYVEVDAALGYVITPIRDKTGCLTYNFGQLITAHREGKFQVEWKP